MVFENIFNKLKINDSDDEQELIELDFNNEPGKTSGRMVISVDRLDDYADSDRIQRKIREGYVVLVSIRDLREKDVGELKRAVARIRKTCVAVNGDIAGVSNDWVIVTPEYAKIHREQAVSQKEEETN